MHHIPKLPAALAAVLSLSLSALAVAHIAGSIRDAVADHARPETDTAQDADRKPAETLDFAGVRPKMQVGELLPGSGYYTRLLSAVVGPKGHVFAIVPPKRPDAAADAPSRAERLAPITSDAHYANVSVITTRLATLALPSDLDLVWTSRNYHDFHNVKDTNVADLDRAVFAALKPGGVFLVLDHAAEAGSGLRDTATLHRIDAAAVRQEVESAGFHFAGSSNVLYNKADDHTTKVFEGSVKGHTDQFILKFVKPK
ncbi:MAG: class I SAM-dependent methyltransferase [Proteobacteria bacterium]|nr:class I SAM-dependent methyltransferase [Pseudomonadota bacterium]